MRPQPTVAVLGAGGHAKVVIATLEAMGRESIMLFDDDPAKWGNRLMGYPTVGPLDHVREQNIQTGVIAIGDNRRRMEVASKLCLDWLSLVHPLACIHFSVALGPGTVVFARAVIQPDTIVGAHAIINTAATLEHDCRIGDFAHIAPRTALCGGVEVGEGSLVGVGASAVPGVEIGRWATIGAGAAVVRDVSDRAVAVGVPARPVSIKTGKGAP